MPFFCLRLLYFLHANPHETIGIYVTQNDNESNHAAAHTAKQTHTDNPEQQQQTTNMKVKKKTSFSPTKTQTSFEPWTKNLEKQQKNISRLSRIK